MLTIWGTKPDPHGDGVSRREFLRLGALGAGGLTLADLLRLRAQGAPLARSSNKAVIMIYLCGAPPHQDMYDLKPDAPVEYRGEFRPIRTNVPGFDVCELMPLQAKIADKLAVVRNMRALATDTHMPEELLSGFPWGPEGGPFSLKPGTRPTFGSVVSKLRPSNGTNLPPYVSLDMARMPHGFRRQLGQEPAFLGQAHQPFDPSSQEGMANLRLPDGVTPGRLGDRKKLLGAFDDLRRDLETAK